jgi:hypothetical protein
MFKTIGKNVKLMSICKHYGIDEDGEVAMAVLHNDTNSGEKGLGIYDDVRLHRLVSLSKEILPNHERVKMRERLIDDREYRKKMFRIYNEKIVPAVERLSDSSAIRVATQAILHGRIKELDN